MKFFRPARYSLFHSLFRKTELTPPTDRLLLRLLFFVIIFSGAWYLYTVNEMYSEEIPVSGGVLREGIVGTPRFVNPALANTHADHDMTALVYSGLMKLGADGTLEPDLAESVTIAEDGMTYNVVLRQDIYFHDGRPVTAEDVVYTIRLIQDPDLKSPLRGNWTGVEIETISDSEFNIILEEPYSPFIENFTVGILPAHLWSELPTEQIPFSQLNSEPIGSGPFQVSDASRDPSGVITGYTLTSYRNHTEAPNIETIAVSFFENEQAVIAAFTEGLLDASAYISNGRLSDVTDLSEYTVISKPLPRVFAVFFNQNRNPALRDAAVREALAISAPRDAIIEEVLFGQGVPMTGPIKTASNTLESVQGSDATSTEAVTDAATILADAGWRPNNQGLLEKQIDDATVTLEVTLRTSNAPLFAEISRALKRAWEDLGITVTVDQYEQSDLVQSVIRPREFEALLFGLDMNRSRDLYPFWHSSQQDDPGLNIAQYTNLDVDELLEEARTEQDPSNRTELLQQASAIIVNEQPAIFLFEPTTSYVVNDNFIIPNTTLLGRPADRFSNINDWYTTSEKLWNIFNKSE